MRKSFEKNKNSSKQFWLVPIGIENELNHIAEKLRNKNSKNESLDSTVDIITKNPIEQIEFNSEIISANASKAKNKTLLLIVVVCISLSVFLNNFFIKKIDPIFVNLLSLSSIPFQEKIPTKTIGKFSDLESAKSEAIKLLPQHKQIDIKFKNGFYTLEVMSGFKK